MSYWKRIISLLFVVFFFYSCNELPIKVKYESKYVKDNYASYSKIRNSLIDTLNKWKRDSLSISIGFFYDNDWQVDSMLIFNQDSSRFFTTMNRKQHYVVGSLIL